MSDLIRLFYHKNIRAEYVIPYTIRHATYQKKPVHASSSSGLYKMEAMSDLDSFITRILGQSMGYLTRYGTLHNKRNLFMHHHHHHHDSLQNGSHIRLNQTLYHKNIISEIFSACAQHIQTSGTRNTTYARMHTNKKQRLQACQASTPALGPSRLPFNVYLASIPGVNQLKH